MSNGVLYRTIREQIVEQLRREVLSGQLTEGQPLREQRLAERFGVSRGPIRDALLQLTQEGLLISQPNCGVRVGQAPSESIQPMVVDFRRRLEAHALAILFDRDGGTHASCLLVNLESVLERLWNASRSADMPAFVEHDMAFHRTIVEAPGDADLLAIWLSIILRMRLIYSRHADLGESYREHEAVVVAMQSGDRDGAIQALEANIQ